MELLDRGEFKRAIFACSLAAAVCALGLTAPASLAWEYVQGPPKVETAAWHGMKPGKGERTFYFSVSSGYCVGEPPPDIDHVEVVERPKSSKRPFKFAVITVFLRFPAPTEVVGSANPDEPQPGCAGIGLGILSRVKLKRKVNDLVLFDGHFSPPRRSWSLAR